jgi:hypothetical protein
VTDDDPNESYEVGRAIKTNDSDVEYHVTDMARAVAVARQF